MKLVKTLLIAGLTTLSVAAFAGEKTDHSATTHDAQLSSQSTTQAPEGATVVSTQDSATLSSQPNATSSDAQLNQAAADAQTTSPSAEKTALEQDQDKKDKQ
ncbi:hypothetical protein SAMN05421749_104207 [Acinetobacter marinus]|uniref:Uncharacterized protein n=1 Tax=Acinetobacter marinus TaxID=281375 RepID=A0A1G6KVK0_9GAMM|nr:hypothetical protein [Acinetobacter marinus]SDC35132.1 hypothetical protein SAMN05421749_104207 [Acinetobacter marinus]